MQKLYTSTKMKVYLLYTKLQFNILNLIDFLF